MLQNGSSLVYGRLKLIVFKGREGLWCRAGNPCKLLNSCFHHNSAGPVKLFRLLELVGFSWCHLSKCWIVTYHQTSRNIFKQLILIPMNVSGCLDWLAMQLSPVFRDVSSYMRDILQEIRYVRRRVMPIPLIKNHQSRGLPHYSIGGKPNSPRGFSSLVGFR